MDANEIVLPWREAVRSVPKNPNDVMLRRSDDVVVFRERVVICDGFASERERIIDPSSANFILLLSIPYLDAIKLWALENSPVSDNFEPEIICSVTVLFENPNFSASDPEIEIVDDVVERFLGKSITSLAPVPAALIVKVSPSLGLPLDAMFNPSMVAGNEANDVCVPSGRVAVHS